MFESGSKFKSAIPSCFICKNQYDSYYRIPRVIPKCGHTYCEKCINNTLQTKANRKVFVCSECQSQTIIRKTAADDIPKNIGILDIVKNLKKKQFQQSSPSNYKSPLKDSPTKPKTFCKQHPAKQLDLICQTCKYQKVCSICVLIGNIHQQHKFVEFIPASSLDLNQVKQVFSIIEDTIKQTVLPNSEFNILVKAQENLIKMLAQSVKNYFKEHYYSIIQKKQQQVLSQFKQIKLQGGISKKIQQIAKNYDILKHQYSDITVNNKIFNQSSKKTSLEIVQNFIKECKNLHNQIEIFSEHTDKQAKKYFNDITMKLNQTTFFRISEVPFHLKSLVVEKVESSTPFKDKSQNRNHVIGDSRKAKNSVDFNLKNSRYSSINNQKNNYQTLQVKSFENLNFQSQQNKKPSTLNAKTKSSLLPPKHKISKQQQKSEKQIQKKDVQIIPLLHLNNKMNDKKSPVNSQKKSASNTQRLNKSSFDNLKQEKRSVDKTKLNQSHISKFQLSQQDSNPCNETHLRIKQMRPMKQIPLNMKAKYSSILKQITRQAQNQTLQLIGMQINDSLISHICQYLKTKKLKFSMIKLVKNNLTDQGMSILLGYLKSDDLTQVLNLTSNQLTSKSLDLIIELGNQNNFLKTIYLSHNKVSAFHMKQKAKEFQSVGIQIII